MTIIHLGLMFMTGFMLAWNGIDLTNPVFWLVIVPYSFTTWVTARVVSLIWEGVKEAYKE